MNKSSSALKILKGLALAGSGVGTAAAFDTIQHDEPFWNDLDNISTKRKVNLGLNTLLGAGGGGALLAGKVGPAAAAYGSVPIKDLAINFQDTPGKVNTTLDGLKSTVSEIQGSSNFRNKLLTALGLGALGIGGAVGGKYLLSKSTKEDPKNRVKVLLPGKEGDPYTDVEYDLSLDSSVISPAVREGLDRGLRKQLRAGIKERTFKRDPETGSLIPSSQYRRKYGDSIDSADEEVFDINDIPVENEYFAKAAHNTREESYDIECYVEDLLNVLK